MATIKSYTDLSQSKVLAEILPLESADNYWIKGDTETPKIYPKDMMKDSVSVNVPCWSLAALLDVLPSGKALIHDKESSEYKCISYTTDTAFYDNPIDACVAMIEKLHGLNLL